MNTKFKDLPILETTKEALEFYNLTDATAIQQLAIPKMLEGKDFIAQAQTGTGKTFAFAIPMVEMIDPNSKNINGLVITPTRELSIQVFKEFLKLVKFYPKLKIALIVGGESYTKQFRELAKNPHIIIATPGRIIDHMERKKVDLSHLNILALDEADEMLKMGFQEDLETILKDTPSTRQTVLFSATMPEFIKKIAKEYQNNSEIIKTEMKSLTLDNIAQYYYLVKREDKLNLLIRLLDLKNINSGIIFANTKADVDRITLHLKDNGYSADSLHGDLKQVQRNTVMQAIRRGDIKMLVATDVAARGLDINNLEIVVNYDIPQQDEIYVHRIGRTGRAGKTGESYSFVTPSKRRNVAILEKYTKSTITHLEIPTEEDISKQNTKAVKDKIKDIIMKNNDENYLYLVKEYLQSEDVKDALINALLKELIPSKKEYPKIDIVRKPEQRQRRDRNQRGANNDNNNRNNRNNRGNNSNNQRDNQRGNQRDNRKERSNNNSEFTKFIINVGKSDNMTPVQLFKMLEFNYKIFSRDIGNIKHNKNDTVFELRTNALNKFDLNKKLSAKNKHISITRV